MKKLLTLIAVVAATFSSMPQAEAHGRDRGYTYVSGRTSCGCPVYVRRYVAFYDRWGNPVVRVRRLPVRHRCHDRGRVRRFDAGYVHPAPGYRYGPVFAARPVPRRHCR